MSYFQQTVINMNHAVRLLPIPYQKGCQQALFSRTDEAITHKASDLTSSPHAASLPVFFPSHLFLTTR